MLQTTLFGLAIAFSQCLYYCYCDDYGKVYLTALVWSEQQAQTDTKTAPRRPVPMDAHKLYWSRVYPSISAGRRGMEKGEAGFACCTGSGEHSRCQSNSVPGERCGLMIMLENIPKWTTEHSQQDERCTCWLLRECGAIGTTCQSCSLYPDIG